MKGITKKILLKSKLKFTFNEKFKINFLDDKTL